MGIVERREREKELRRQSIIDAAERVFFSKGMEQATVDDIAEAAELSKGTIYLYFKSKEELYLAIHLRGLDILDKLFTDAIRTGRNGFEQVKAIGEAYFEYYRSYPEYFNALSYYETLAIDYENPDPLLEECLTRGDGVNGIVLQSIQRGIEDGSIRSDIDPFKVSLILWGQTTGLILFAAHKKELIRHKYGVSDEDLFTFYMEYMIQTLKSGVL